MLTKPMIEHVEHAAHDLDYKITSMVSNSYPNVRRFYVYYGDTLLTNYGFYNIEMASEFIVRHRFREDCNS